MQLWEKGLLDLDSDVNVYLPFSVRNPRFPDIPITIKQLLTHTSSIHDSPVYEKSYECRKPKLSLKQWNEYYFEIDGIFYDKNKNFTKYQPGTNREYSNVGFGLLGYIVEEVSKIPFNDYCRKNIFEPLGMVNTGWFYNEVDTNNQITNYYFLDKKSINDSELQKLALNKPTRKDLHSNIPLCKYSFPTYPDGGIITSVRELSIFLRAMINDGTYENIQILQKETIDKMLTVYIEEEGAEQLQGLCWNKSIFKSFWGHSGGDYGIHTYMYLNRANSVGIITFQNSISANPWKFVAKLYRIVENEMN
jgi:CubicO group peptidase (beta-lactamase class C family)